MNITADLNRPEDFYGHSLSISDVIVTRKDGVENAFYVDSFGFKKLPDFVPQLRSPEISAEETAMILNGVWDIVKCAQKDNQSSQTN